MIRLPVLLKPLEDESLQSWIIRNSFANGSDPKAFFTAVWGNFNMFKRDIDKILSKQEAMKLSKATSTSIDKIKLMTLEPYMNNVITFKKLTANSFWYFVIPTGQRGTARVNGIHFCPECLKDKNPYLKRQWKLAWNIGCPIHGIKLHNRCPKCNSTFSPKMLSYKDNKIYLCSSCGFDLRKAKTTKADINILKFQELLNSIFFEGKPFKLLSLKTNKLSDIFLSIRILISFIQYVHRIKKYNRLFDFLGIKKNDQYNDKRVSFEKMEVDEREYFLNIIYRFLVQDIDLIKYELKRLKVSKKILQLRYEYIPETIEYLAKDLVEHKERHIASKNNKTIKPKSKTEVLELSNRIMRFYETKNR